MNKIEYRIGDLFTAPVGSLLVHSCNAQGVWGAGIAKVFKQKFPDSYKAYLSFCKNQSEKSSTDPVGRALIFSEKDYRIGCLITSRYFGKRVDDPAQILQSTHTSLQELLSHLSDGDQIHMPRINSGLFRTPWSETEKCIEYLLDNSTKKVQCIVWIREQDLVEDDNEQTTTIQGKDEKTSFQLAATNYKAYPNKE